MDEKLIDSVKKFPCIWNTSSEFYKCNETKDAAWNQIIVETKISHVKTAKSRWKELRDNHRDALIRQNATRSGQTRKQQKEWKYQKAMSFLLPYMCNRDRSSNFAPLDDAASETSNPPNTIDESSRVSNDQLEELLEFLKEHPALTKGVGLGVRSKEAIDKLWENLASKLNSHGSGSSKPAERWKKYWADIKHKTKARLAKRRRDAFGTGGGPSRQDDLSEVDRKILSIIGEQAVYGDTEHRIPFITEETIESPNAYELPGSKTDDVPVIVISEPITLVSPSTSGQTSKLYTPQDQETGPSMSVKMDLNTEPPLTGLESPVARPRTSRPRKYNSPYKVGKKSKVQSRIDPEWVMGLESRRVDAETKHADAALIMAEAAKLQAESANAHAEAAKVQAEAAKVQAEAAKVQADTMRSIVDVVSALTTSHHTTQQEHFKSIINILRDKF